MSSLPLSPIERLPDEIRRRIGSVCEINDRMSLTLVSKAWQDAGEAAMWGMVMAGPLERAVPLNNYFAAHKSTDPITRLRASPQARKCQTFDARGPACYASAVQCLYALKRRPIRASFARMLEMNACEATLETYKEIFEMTKHVVDNLCVGDHSDMDAFGDGQIKIDRQLSDWDLMELHRFIIGHGSLPSIQHLELHWYRGPDIGILTRYLQICPRLTSMNLYCGPRLPVPPTPLPSSYYSGHFDPEPLRPDQEIVAQIETLGFDGAIQILTELPVAIWQSPKLSWLQISLEIGWLPEHVDELKDTGELASMGNLAIMRIKPTYHVHPSSCLLRRFIENGMRNVPHLYLEEDWNGNDLWDLPKLRILAMSDETSRDYDVGVGKPTSAKHSKPLREWFVKLLDHYPELCFVNISQVSVKRRRLPKASRRTFFVIKHFIDREKEDRSFFHVRYVMHNGLTYVPEGLDPHEAPNEGYLSTVDWTDATYYRGRYVSSSVLQALYRIDKISPSFHMGVRHCQLSEKAWAYLEKAHAKMPIVPDPLPAGKDEFSAGNVGREESDSDEWDTDEDDMDDFNGFLGDEDEDDMMMDPWMDLYMGGD